MSRRRITFDEVRFREEIAGTCPAIAVAMIEIAALDLAGHHRDRANLILVTRTWLDDLGRVPFGPEATAKAIEVMRGRSKVPEVAYLWERLIEALELFAKLDAEAAATKEARS